MNLVSKVPALIGAKQLRENRLFSQQEIAEAVGVSEATISKLLQGKSDIGNIRLKTALELSRWLGCSVEDLFEEDG